MIKRCIYCGRYFKHKEKEKICKECAIEYRTIVKNLTKNQSKESLWTPT